MGLDDRHVVVFATLEQIGVARFKTEEAARKVAEWLHEQGHAVVVVEDI